MKDIDRAMIGDIGISLIQMMENAGRGLAAVAREVFRDGRAIGKSVVILAGSGGNGGGAITAARRLAAWGAHVSLGLTRPAEDITRVPRRQIDILSRVAEVTAIDPETFCPCDLVIDGLIGYSLDGALRGRALDLIEAIRAMNAPVLFLDVPSGLTAKITCLSGLAAERRSAKTSMTDSSCRGNQRQQSPRISVYPGIDFASAANGRNAGCDRGTRAG